MKRLLSNAVFNRVPSNRLRLVWIAFFCVGWNFLLHQVAVSGDDGIGSIFAQTAPQGTTKRLRQVPAATQGAELDREISQVRFVEPLKAKVALFSADNKFTEIVTIPSRHDFERSTTYRLRVSQIASRPGLTLYPTLQIYPAHPASADYLREQQLKVAITDHDLDYVETGGYLRKVLYLVDPKYQSRPLPGQDSLTEIVSTAATDMGTKLDPGVDPIIEANRRGKILYVLRMGTIDMGSMDRELPTPLTDARQTPAKNRPLKSPTLAQLRFVSPYDMTIRWQEKSGNLSDSFMNYAGASPRVSVRIFRAA